MRIIAVSAAAALVFAATPAQAVGLGDLAKVVLGGSSVLKKGQEVCGTSFNLTRQEDLALAMARSAAERALPMSEFMSLDTSTKAEADTASKSSTFCDTTKKEKTGILTKVKKAGKDIIKKRVLG